MRKKYKVLGLILLVIAVVAVAVVYLHGRNIDVLEPRGQVGYKERGLIIFAVLLSVIVVVPTFSLTIFIALRYREGNPKAKKYSPDFDHSRLLESVWWGIPIVIIGILSVATWNSSHSLDPYKSLVSDKKPLQVDVVAMDWKWLFIYPQQNIASVNLLELPVNTPVDFNLTSDTVMNSFWIPQLGGQIYVMPGMNTQLHLMASKTGSFYGSPANIAGKGFAYMTFTAKSAPQPSFDKWVQSAQQSPDKLDGSTYEQLAKPSESNPVAYYSSVQSDLYNDIMMQYMMPGMSLSNSGTQQ